MNQRVQYVPGWPPVGWDDVLRMRDYYQPWNDNALTVDSMVSPEANLLRVLDYVQSAGQYMYIPNQPTENFE
jgi:hypothetical protein